MVIDEVAERVVPKRADGAVERGREAPSGTGAGERRRYPRVKSIVYFRRPLTMSHEVLADDLSLGGMRVTWNEPVHTDELLELEVLTGDGDSVVCSGRVAWVQELPLASPSRYEAGIEFLGLPRESVHRLEGVLEEDSPSHTPMVQGLTKFDQGPRVRAPRATPGDLLRSVGLSRIADLFRIS